MKTMTLTIKGGLNDTLAALLAHRISYAKSTVTYPHALHAGRERTVTYPITRVVVDGTYQREVEAWAAEAAQGYPPGSLLSSFTQPIDAATPAVF